MDLSEKFKTFTIHTVMCRGGTPIVKHFLMGLMKISQVTLGGWAGGSRKYQTTGKSRVYEDLFEYDTEIHPKKNFST